MKLPSILLFSESKSLLFILQRLNECSYNYDCRNRPRKIAFCWSGKKECTQNIAVIFDLSLKYYYNFMLMCILFVALSTDKQRISCNNVSIYLLISLSDGYDLQQVFCYLQSQSILFLWRTTFIVVILNRTVASDTSQSGSPLLSRLISCTLSNSFSVTTLVWAFSI